MYQVTYVFGHYNVYAPSGRFLFSADTEQEALDDLAEMMQEGWYASSVSVA